MKKILSLLLVLLMVVSLSGCELNFGGNPAATTASTVPENWPPIGWTETLEETLAATYPVRPTEPPQPEDLLPPQTDPTGPVITEPGETYPTVTEDPQPTDDTRPETDRPVSTQPSGTTPQVTQPTQPTLPEQTDPPTTQPTTQSTQPTQPAQPTQPTQSEDDRPVYVPPTTQPPQSEEDRPVYTQPAETQPVQTQPTETQPPQTQPTETQPAQTQPASKLDPNGSYDSVYAVAEFIVTYGRLPNNYITKSRAKQLGWSGGSLERYAPGKCIGGDRFYNNEGLLPKGYVYYECDIGTLGASSRGQRRLVFTYSGIVYYTKDHYQSFTRIY